MSELNEVIRELANIFPEVMAEELSDALVRELQLAIPRAIQQMRLPKPVTLTDAKLAQLKLLRRKTVIRSSMKERQLSRERFWTELHQLRHSMNGREASGTSITPSRLWDTVPNEAPDISMYDGQPSLSETALSFDKQNLDSEVPAVTSRPIPYVDVSQRDSQTRVRKFGLNEEFVKRLENHPIYWRVAMSIEEATRDFAEQTKSDWDFQLVAESDVEIPTWKRFILSIATSITNVDERVRQWDLLDAAVRRRIREIVEKYPEHRDEILQFNKSFFLKMEMA